MSIMTAGIEFDHHYDPQGDMPYVSVVSRVRLLMVLRPTRVTRSSTAPNCS
jgi:hypothetical protein